MSLLQSKSDRALDLIQKAAHEGDLIALAKAEEDLVKALEEMHPEKETPEVTSPSRRVAPAPTACEQAGAAVLAFVGLIVTVLLFLALCAGPDRW